MKKITILGFGVMGKQMASLFYALGYRVHVFSKSSINQSLSIKRTIKLFQRKLNLSKIGNITFLDDLSEVPNSVVIETISESLTEKIELYNKINPLTIKEYCANASSYKHSDIGAFVVGGHFFNPIYIIHIIEVCTPITFEFSQDFQSLINDLKAVIFTKINVTNTLGYYGNLFFFFFIFLDYLILLRTMKQAFMTLIKCISRFMIIV